jgi:hypothetical protein
MAAFVLLVTALGYAAWFWAARGTWVSATRRIAAGGKWGRVAKVMIVLGGLGTAQHLFARDLSRIGEQWHTLLGKQHGPQYVIRVSGDGKSLEVTGGMNDGAAAAVTEALVRAPGVRTVSLDSGGGWIREGRLLAEVISQHGLSTTVERECSSACTLAFLAGKERTLGPGALLGFHQVLSGGQTASMRRLSEVETETIYRTVGLPADFINKVLATPPDKIWYPTPAELSAAKVITGRTSSNSSKISDPAFTAMLDCKVRGLVDWSNTTSCAFRSDDSGKSFQEHFQEQRACLERAGSAAKMREIGLACATVTALGAP